MPPFALSGSAIVQKKDGTVVPNREVPPECTETFIWHAGFNGDITGTEDKAVLFNIKVCNRVIGATSGRLAFNTKKILYGHCDSDVERHTKRNEFLMFLFTQDRCISYIQDNQ